MGDARVHAKITAGIMRIVSSVVDDVQRGDLVNRSDAISRRHALRKIDAPGNGRCWRRFGCVRRSLIAECKLYSVCAWAPDRLGPKPNANGGARDRVPGRGLFI